MRTRITIWIGALALISCTGGTGGPPDQAGETYDELESLAHPSKPNAQRYLEQASFGAKPGQAARVQSIGISAAITDQLGARASLFDVNSTHTLGAQFFEHAMNNNDQLRQRVAFAFSQILVVSQLAFKGLDDKGQTAVGTYLNLLSRDALGDFRTLVYDITVNAAMGRYLTMANNRSYNTDGSTLDPNENYARELLQLFTLGLYLLNDDGSIKLDANGDPRSAYSQDQVEALAHALTGWTYAADSGCPARGRSNPPAHFDQPMIGCDVNHDAHSQRLLLGFRTTEGAGAVQHVNEAIDNILSHPNVAPFVSKQLIQHLVTSNPTPGYVRRITAKFRDDGSGKSGNLAAVVRAILEDDEARGPVPPLRLQPTFGHLRAPALFILSVLRPLNANVTDGTALDAWSADMSQNVPMPPSVFSYYPPNQPLPGSTALLGPEFAIDDSATCFARAGYLTQLSFKTIDGVTPDWETMPARVENIVPWLDEVMLHGTMSSQAKSIVLDAITDARLPPEQARALGLYLTALSPEFQIER